MKFQSMSALSAVCAAVSAGALAVSLSAHAQGATDGAKAPAGAEPAPVFSKAYLSSAASIEKGKAVWQAQCRHCHGSSAYPGKAPKLDPGRMDPDFIFDRVTNGFRKMPSWKAVFSFEERMAVVAYVKSDDFSP